MITISFYLKHKETSYIELDFSFLAFHTSKGYESSAVVYETSTLLPNNSGMLFNNKKVYYFCQKNGVLLSDKLR
ncbi:hypothetical protein IX296_000434 [Bacteroides pyogenes]|nr:hypothetical protein [Bacteroides pyogenes]MBR8737593.1 hypothetical protein [Bacteroides pyogenes]MBR8753168.1 hypothetical protein [Bacteroides pyogenes]MBR8794456.1 hypothetical protein [Bacteroides pyogenes]MBR8808174.1 hypothetical protein [Bacteroides pyogenes]